MLAQDTLLLKLQSALSALGSEGTSINPFKELIKSFDHDIKKRLKDYMTKDGIIIHEQFDTEQVSKSEKLTIRCKTGKEIEDVDTLIWAIGRRPLQTV